MKKLVVLFLLSVIYVSYPQDSLRKQITFMPGADCKNFSTPQILNEHGYFVFEADLGSKTNIFLGKYDVSTDSFSVIKNLTDNNFRNINPSITVLGYSYDSLLLVYQTNERGNWDIALRYIGANSISETNFITNSPGDEVNPQYQRFLWSGDQYTYITYQSMYLQGIGVSIKKILTSDPAMEVFHPTGDNYYNTPTIAESPQTIQVAAAVDSSDGNKYIVSRSFVNNSWQEKQVLMKTDAMNTCFNPFDYSYITSLTFDATDTTNGRRNIFIIDVSYPSDLRKMYDSPQYNYSDFKTIMEPMIVDKSLPHRPYIFKASRNDSTWVVVSKVDNPGYFLEEALVPTKVKETSLGVGPVGSTYRSIYYYYSVWQDSVDGHLQLFGRKTHMVISGVEDDKQNPSSFILQQNYPNPFNPSSNISYTLNKAGYVRLSVIDVLGREVAVLTNEYRQAGSYHVDFKAENFASGIYFYKLTSGGYTRTMKMLLLK